MLGDRSTIISPSYLAWQIIKEKKMKAEIRKRKLTRAEFCSISASKLSVGEIGITMSGAILLRTFNQIASLTEPDQIWDVNYNSIDVRHLRNDEEVVLS